MQQTNLLREANILSRFDRLSFSRAMLKIVAIIGAVSILEAYDLGLIGQAVLLLKQIWSLDPGQTGLLGSCSTVGVVIGAFCCGFLTDRYGRKRVLVWATFTFTLFTLVGPLFDNFYWFVFARFISGLGSGAVFPMPYLYISELVGSKQRGTVVCYCNSILLISYVLPAIVGAWSVSSFALETAWKIPFIVGGVPVFLTFIIWKYMPESPRWLMKRGRFDEATALLEKMEKSAGVAPDSTYADARIVAALEASSRPGAAKASWKLLFKPPYLKRTIVAWGMFTAAFNCWYVVQVYAPSIIRAQGFAMSSSVVMGGALTSIAAVAGLICGPLIDKYGRKPVYVISTLTAATCAAVLAFEPSLTIWLVMGLALGFFGNGAFPIIKLYLAEQYPTELRGTGVGLGEAFSRFVGGVLATYLIAFILALGGQAFVFWFLTASYCIGVLLLAVWGEETVGKSMDMTGSACDISADLSKEAA